MPPRGTKARRAEIVRLARSTGLASVEELSAQFGVTASTIRRDLGLLTDQGHIARTYGGAIALGRQPESSLRQRAMEGFDAKHAIARWAAQQVQPGETILLDAGTTVGAMGDYLGRFAGLTVVTAGLTALEALADADAVRVECIGGTLRHLSQGFVGPLAEATLERLTFDRAFLGADAVTAELGICEAELEQTRLKELMMQGPPNSTCSPTQINWAASRFMPGRPSQPGRPWSPTVLQPTTRSSPSRARASRCCAPPDYESVGQPSTSISTKTCRSILPVALRGSSSMNTTSRGTLWRARLFLT